MARSGVVSLVPLVLVGRSARALPDWDSVAEEWSSLVVFYQKRAAGKATLACLQRVLSSSIRLLRDFSKAPAISLASGHQNCCGGPSAAFVLFPLTHPSTATTPRRRPPHNSRRAHFLALHSLRFAEGASASLIPLQSLRSPTLAQARPAALFSQKKKLTHSSFLPK